MVTPQLDFSLPPRLVPVIKKGIRNSGCYKVVSDLRLTDLKAPLKDCNRELKKIIKTRTCRPKDYLKSECGKRQGVACLCM